MKLTVSNLQKSFASRLIFKDVSFMIEQGNSLAITGHNGSGKTTLIRILCSLLRPDGGEISFNKDNRIIKDFNYNYALVGPYLQLYDELSAFENLLFCARMKKTFTSSQDIYRMIEQVGLKGRAHDYVKTFSSGMKQRLKYAFALQTNPDVLYLDEPTSNLDKQGIEYVYSIMNEHKKNKILVFATNDEDDLKLADRVVHIDA